VLPSIVHRLTEVAGHRIWQVSVGLLAGLIFMADTNSVPRTDFFTGIESTLAYGDKNYRKIIYRARNLPGKVICPDDPTIMLQARKQIDRSLVSERDALGTLGWRQVPAYLPGELKRADYVIRVKGNWTPAFGTNWLVAMNYKPINDPVFHRTAYELWQRQIPNPKKKPKKKPATTQAVQAVPK
jgi:hypothetical protein